VLCSFRIARERQEFLIAMTKHMQYPKMITLTMSAWRRDPYEGIQFLRRSFNQLRRTEVFKPVVGGAYIIEVKPDPDYYHIHMHVLVDSPYIAYQRLFSAWRQILKQRAPQVDIRAAQNKHAREYIAKDASKNIAFYVNPQSVVKWYLATRSTRLFATFGNWYQVDAESLMDQRAWEKIRPVCPFCGQSDSCFYATQGPFLYGYDTWREDWMPLLCNFPEIIPVEFDVV